MLNKPKFLLPNINTSEGVIQADTSMPFSFVVDGNEPITKAYFTIYGLSGNAIMFFTADRNTRQEMFDENGYFYPVNEKNENNVFECAFSNRNAADTTLLSNRKEPCYWTVTLTSASGATVTSAPAVFYANTNPLVTIKYAEGDTYVDLTDSTVIRSRSCTFKAEYSQAEGVPLKRYGWRLTDTKSGRVLIDTVSHNQIYGTAHNILCSCEGLIGGNEYSIELYIETQNGYSQIYKKVFDVKYDAKTLFTDFDIQAIDSSSCVMLDWKNLKTTEGVTQGDDVIRMANYPITSYKEEAGEDGEKISVSNGTNSISIKNDSSVIFEGNANTKLEIPEDSYISLSFQITKDEDMKLLEMTGVDAFSNTITRTLRYISEDKSLIHMINKSNGDSAFKIQNLNYYPKDEVWYIVTLHPLLKNNDGSCYTEMDVVESYAEEALYPSGDNYPSDDLQPFNGVWDK